MRVSLVFVLIAISLAFSSPSNAQQGDGTNVDWPTHIFKPNLVPATPERIAKLSVPAGFSVNLFAKDLKNARIIAVSDEGFIYVSRRDQGDIILLTDKDGDGKADAPPVIVLRQAGAHGLAIKGHQLFIVTVKELYVSDIQPDGRLGEPKQLIKDLPDAGQHANRTIAVGPDGWLYISVGSTCNACNEANQENATILRVSLDGKSRSIFATGLRNTIGFDWQPQTGELWGVDNGIDFLGDLVQPEELNRIEFGKNYGWPHIWGTDGINPQSTPVGGISKDEWKKMSTPMVLGYDAHAAPMQLKFARGESMSPEHRCDAFVTFRGSWNRNPAAGYEIAYVKFTDGKPVRFEHFLTGFLTDGGQVHFARPMGLAFAKDGSLLMADDANGVIYRVSFKGGSIGKEMQPPETAMKEQTSKGSGVELTLKRVEASSSDAIQVSSPTFTTNGKIPERQSEYGDKVSPALSWKQVPDAKSYAVIVEDPDGKFPTPVVHWVAWNIPSSITNLPEGLQKQPRLTEPEGILQGRTSHGSVGYFGPRPPIGDPDHHYHFQILALDKMLDILPGSDRDEVLAAAKGSIIAKGELIGTFSQTTPTN